MFDTTITFSEFEDFHSGWSRGPHIKRKKVTNRNFEGWEIRGSTSHYGSDEVYKYGVKVAAVFKPSGEIMFLTENKQWQEQISTFIESVNESMRFHDEYIAQKERDEAAARLAARKEKQEQEIRKAFET